MRYRNLGKWGLRVSDVGLGSWLTFGGSVDEETSAVCIHRAYELGVNFFDTANVYHRGAAEVVVGKALEGYPRDSYVLATKVFFPMGARPNDWGLSRKHVTEQCNQSLARLGVDYVDLYQCHRYDQQTPLEETCRVMEDLIVAGKILYWGVSEWTAAQIQEAVALCLREGWHPPVSNQPQYSMLHRDIEKEVLPTCREKGLGLVVFSPLAQGVLSGKYRSPDDLPPDSRAARERDNMFMGPLLTAENLARVEKLRRIADGLGWPLARLALAWCLRNEEVSSVIVGATRVEQVDQNVDATETPLDAGTVEAVDQALAD
ncbi:MAG: aldo/keto reductase family protein [Actinomycetota bacterium]